MAASRYELGDVQWAKIAPLFPHDEAAYTHRNRIERCFNRMKHFRRFATRYDRRIIHFEGFLYLLAAMLWLR